jgi:hypothetical protein
MAVALTHVVSWNPAKYTVLTPRGDGALEEVPVLRRIHRISLPLGHHPTGTTDVETVGPFAVDVGHRNTQVRQRMVHASVSELARGVLRPDKHDAGAWWPPRKEAAKLGKGVDVGPDLA